MDEGIKRLAAAVIHQAYDDIKRGGIRGEAAVQDVKDGGLDLYLDILLADVKPNTVNIYVASDWIIKKALSERKSS